MRLVIDGRRLGADRTGVGRYLETLLREWAETGLPFDETIVVLHRPNGRTAVPDCRAFRAEVEGSGLPSILWERWCLARRLRRGDLLFAPSNLIPGNWRGRTVLVLHDAIQEVLPDGFRSSVRRWYGRRYRKAARRASRILVPSHSTARDVARVYGLEAGRLGVIPPGPDPRFRPLTAASELAIEARRRVGLGDAPYFLFVGKRSARRNLPAVLEAFEQHRARSPDHRLVFAGPIGDRKEAETLAATPGVILAGYVSDEILHGLLARAIALIYPSSYEGFGLPIVEALASGCPAITLRNSALTEAGGDAALYLDRPDARELARAMHQLATDPAARRRHVEAGLTHVAGLTPAAFAAAVKAELAAVAGLGEPPRHDAMRSK